MNSQINYNYYNIDFDKMAAHALAFDRLELDGQILELLQMQAHKLAASMCAANSWAAWKEASANASSVKTANVVNANA